MENERLIQILNLLVHNLETNHIDFNTGICSVISTEAYKKEISFSEEMAVKTVILKNKPTKKNQYKEFTKNENWIDSEYWWTRIKYAPETRKIRIDYLKKLIENYSK